MEECVICFDRLCVPEVFYICGHHFCAECAARCDVCATCRSERIPLEAPPPPPPPAIFHVSPEFEMGVQAQLERIEREQAVVFDRQRADMARRTLVDLDPATRFAANALYESVVDQMEHAREMGERAREMAERARARGQEMAERARERAERARERAVHARERAVERAERAAERAESKRHKS